MSKPRPSYRVLRLLCANAVGMAAFLAAYVVARDPRVAVAAAVVIALIGYVASSAVVDYAVDAGID
jgi:multisubunit Na+/H+ antiporter MnhF subunit